MSIARGEKKTNTIEKKRCSHQVFFCKLCAPHRIRLCDSSIEWDYMRMVLHGCVRRQKGKHFFFRKEKGKYILNKSICQSSSHKFKTVFTPHNWNALFYISTWVCECMLFVWLEILMCQAPKRLNKINCLKCWDAFRFALSFQSVRWQWHKQRFTEPGGRRK